MYVRKARGGRGSGVAVRACALPRGWPQSWDLAPGVGGAAGGGGGAAAAAWGLTGGIQDGGGAAGDCSRPPAVSPSFIAAVTGGAT